MSKWRDNIGRKSGPLASVYWCKLCTDNKPFKVVVSGNRGLASSSRAMAEIQAHIKATHQRGDTP